MRIKEVMSNIAKFVVGSFLLVGLVTMSSFPVFAQKAETIEAQAMGTGTQLGQSIGITLIINDYSTMAERQILVQAFAKGQNQGLVNALTRMRTVGHIAITGTLGYDVAFIT